jgi:hypothetical protein
MENFLWPTENGPPLVNHEKSLRAAPPRTPPRQMPLSVRLSGPEGNAFALMGLVKSLGVQLGSKHLGHLDRDEEQRLRTFGLRVCRKLWLRRRHLQRRRDVLTV